MSVYMYDDAIVDNLREITKDARVSILPPETKFKISAALDDDKITLPMVSLQRTGWSIVRNRATHIMKHEGTSLSYDEEKDLYKNFQLIPIRINYNMDVWSKTREDNDNFIRELIWYYEVHPSMTVKVPYSLNYEHKFNVFFDDEIEDNSDIIEHSNRGIYFRQTLAMYTDDAYLWKASSRHPSFIKADILIDTGNGRIENGGEV